MNKNFAIFLVIICLVNTVAFTFCRLYGFPIWQAVLVEVILFFGFIMVKAWFSPAQQRANQAASMGWAAHGFDKDSEGLRETLLIRGGVIARISAKSGYIYIDEPIPLGPFRDFVEVERKLADLGY